MVLALPRSKREPPPGLSRGQQPTLSLRIQDGLLSHWPSTVRAQLLASRTFASLECDPATVGRFLLVGPDGTAL
eukprot:m.416475 g.416475  ORF g.416475 m.416475 type:complete len:74 (-) comp29990_c0_seq1:168-389(-)